MFRGGLTRRGVTRRWMFRHGSTRRPIFRGGRERRGGFARLGLPNRTGGGCWLGRVGWVRDRGGGVICGARIELVRGAITRWVGWWSNRARHFSLRPASRCCGRNATRRQRSGSCRFAGDRLAGGQLARGRLAGRCRLVQRDLGREVRSGCSAGFGVHPTRWLVRSRCGWFLTCGRFSTCGRLLTWGTLSAR